MLTRRLRLSFTLLTLPLRHTIYVSAQFTITENIDTTVYFGFSSSHGTSSRLSSSPSTQVDCDGHGIFVCPTGTCYTTAGYVGCCTGSSCVPRTTCLEFNSTPFASCDAIIGGCITCSDIAAPACVTISNSMASQYGLSCGLTRTLILTAYTNIFATDSATLFSAMSAPPITMSRAATANPLSSPTTTTPFSHAASVSSTTPSTTTLGSPLTTTIVVHTTLPTTSTIGIALDTRVAVAAVSAMLLFLLLRRRRRARFCASPYTIMPPSDDITDRDTHPTELDSTEKSSPELPASPSTTVTPISLGISELVGSPPVSIIPHGIDATVISAPASALMPSPLFSVSTTLRHLSVTPSRPVSPMTPQLALSSHFAPPASDWASGIWQSRRAIADATTSLGFLSAEEAMRDGYRENGAAGVRASTSETKVRGAEKESTTGSPNAKA